MAKAKKHATKSEVLKMQIIAIRDMGFKMNESFFIEGKEAKVDFRQTTSIGKKENILIFELNIVMYYVENPNNLLIESTSKHTFSINELEKFVGNDNEILLPASGIVSIVGTCVSQARALISKNTAGSIYQYTLVPLIDALEMSKAFFPYIIPEIEEYSLVKK